MVQAPVYIYATYVRTYLHSVCSWLRMLCNSQEYRSYCTDRYHIWLQKLNHYNVNDVLSLLAVLSYHETIQ